MTAPPADTPADQARDHVESVVKDSGTSFYWGMRCLPAEKRNAMYAVYAFCREVDDIADGDGEEADKLARLGLWRGEIERLYGEHPRRPVSVALLEPVERFQLRKEDFLALVAGMEMDARARVRIRDMDELDLYCDRVAAAVGRLSVRVFGLEDGKGRAIAFSLGRALQLTNILRDLDEDAGRDRLYLPADVLAAHGIPGDDPRRVLRHPELSRVCELLADIAKRRFDEAVAVIAACDRRQVRPAVLMMEFYRRILRQLSKRGWRNATDPVRLSKLEKLWVVLRHGVV
jgi:phytoene synthase